MTQTKRTPIPKILLDYRKQCDRMKPKVCYNCDHYSGTGICEVYKDAPPPEFTEIANQCDQWLEEIPF